MINSFMPDFNLGVVGAWSEEPIYNALWDCMIPDVIRPSMFVLDCTGFDPVWDHDPVELPIIAVHKIPSFRSTFTKSNHVHSKYYRGYNFVSFGTFYDSDAYFMLVFVEKK